MSCVFRSLLTFTLFALAVSPAVAQGGKKSSNGAAPVAPFADVAVCGSVAFKNGQMQCSCPDGAGASGSVWGSGPYTADSAICKAAVHAGVITEAGGVVTLLQAPGQDAYEGSLANGVSTNGWGSYGESFAFAASKSPPAPDSVVNSALPTCSTLPDDADTHSCNCPANGPDRSIWGNDPYTADSDICTAARHVGYIEADGGDVHVLRVQGLSSYHSDENNGITSGAWDSYVASIVFDWNR